jgi:hypothetical protein
MRLQVRNLPKIALLALALTGPIVPTQASAQTYPIDCAILLCLSGGWPASVPCARARAEFIRRITPWPVEPPLQIWRCPMGASFDGPARSRPTDRIVNLHSKLTQRDHLKMTHLRGSKAHRRAAPM